MNQPDKISADAEITILSAAYTSYCQLAENPIPPDEFRAKYRENCYEFSNLVLGCTEK